MSKEICTVCGREIDSRGMSGHMKTHVSKEGGTDGVISYPTPSNFDPLTSEGIMVKDDKVETLKKTVKKPVASRPASSPPSSPSSKPDTRGQRNSGSKSTGHPKDSGVTEAEHKKEWQGLFRD